MHQRTKIRNAVVALLTGQTDAGSRVYASRVVPYRKGELPTLAVYTLEELVAPESASTAPRELERELELVIEGWVKTGGGVNPDQAMDDLAAQVEVALHRSPYLPAPDVVESVNAGTDELTLTAHGLVTGEGPIHPSSTGTVPGGLNPGGDYFAIVVNANTIKLARTLIDAENGVAVGLTTAGTGTITLKVDQAADSVLRSSRMEVVETGDREMGVLEMTYLVTYRTLAPEAPTGLVDFERVDAVYNLGNVVHPNNDAEDLFTVEAP